MQLLLAPLAAKIPIVIDGSTAITHLESQFIYLSVSFGSVMTLNMALLSYFDGIGRTRVTLLSWLIAQGVGIVATVGLVFGRFGLPELGMIGSTIGNLMGTLAMMACYLAFVPNVLWNAFRRIMSWRAMRSTDARSRIRKGIMLGISVGLKDFGNVVFIWIIAALGPIALSASNVNFTINYIGIIPLVGLGSGCSVLCGKAIGEGNYQQIPRILRAALAIELAYVFAISFFQIVMPELLLKPLGLRETSAEIWQTSISISRVLWIYSIAFAFSMTSGAVLETLGMHRFLLGARLALTWALGIPAIYLIAMQNVGDASSLLTCWIVGSAFEALVGGICFWRIHHAVRNGENRLVPQTR
jgi:MATE family multidrug resistance protein